MIPDYGALINSLLILLLPGFIAIKVWERFFPRTPTQKQDNFDKVATYFTFTIITYLFAIPIIECLVGDPASDFYLSALIASAVAFLLALVAGVVMHIFQSSSKLMHVWAKLDSFLPFRSSIRHRVFHLDRKRKENVVGDKTVVKVGVFMKNGSIYSGEMSYYPIEDNTETGKDFMIKGVTLLKKDGNKIKYPPEFSLLLNQRDVEAILYEYVPEKRLITKKS